MWLVCMCNARLDTQTLIDPHPPPSILTDRRFPLPPRRRGLLCLHGRARLPTAARSDAAAAGAGAAGGGNFEAAVSGDDAAGAGGGGKGRGAAGSAREGEEVREFVRMRFMGGNDEIPV